MKCARCGHKILNRDKLFTVLEFFNHEIILDIKRGLELSNDAVVMHITCDHPTQRDFPNNIRTLLEIPDNVSHPLLR